jgi:hypothetical protein
VTIEVAPVLVMYQSIENKTTQVETKKIGDEELSHQIINATDSSKPDMP